MADSGEEIQYICEVIGFFICNPSVVTSQLKQRGNHKVTVQPLVSGAKIHFSLYFHWEYSVLFPYVGIKASHVATAP